MIKDNDGDSLLLVGEELVPVLEDKVLDYTLTSTGMGFKINQCTTAG